MPRVISDQPCITQGDSQLADACRRVKNQPDFNTKFTEFVAEHQPPEEWQDGLLSEKYKPIKKLNSDLNKVERALIITQRSKRYINAQVDRHPIVLATIPTPAQTPVLSAASQMLAALSDDADGTDGSESDAPNLDFKRRRKRPKRVEEMVSEEEDPLVSSEVDESWLTIDMNSKRGLVNYEST